MSIVKVMVTLPDMLNSLKQAVASFPDKRTGKNTKYQFEDVAMGAFSAFFTQSPSFLAHQRMMQEAQGISNAASLFGLIKIPSDNHIRDLLDEIEAEKVVPVFDFCFNQLQKAGCLEDFRQSTGDLLIALDGTEYFSSETIHCDSCSKKEHQKGKVTYSHSMITPVVVSPDKSQIIPLSPEFITPQDGNIKQDCENQASKRWLKGSGKKFSLLKTTILGDDLYSRQPICAELLKQGFNFILVCKEESHPTLYQWTAGIKQAVVIKDRLNGQKTVETYHYVNQVPLKDGHAAMLVNWCEVTITQEVSGKQLYHNSFITNLEITEENVASIARSGRARWKIENENNNTLKTKGYHLEHNFGHGKKHLAKLLSSFTLLAFLFHTAMELTDTFYQNLRTRLGSRENFFNAIKQLTTFMYFKSWIHLFTYMIEGLKRRHLAPG